MNTPPECRRPGETLFGDSPLSWGTVVPKRTRSAPTLPDGLKVVTLVTGQVPSAKCGEFEAAYQLVKSGTLPEGLERSFLLRKQGGSGVYTIETIWSSVEALQAMRGREKPRAVALFEQVGVSPTVEIHEVADTVP